MTTFNISRKFKNNITILLGLFCILSNPAFAVHRDIVVTGHLAAYIDLTVQNLSFDITQEELLAGPGRIAAKTPRNGNGAINVKCNTGYHLFARAEGANQGAANNLKLTHAAAVGENFDIDLHLLTATNAAINDITGADFLGGAPGRLIHDFAIPDAADRANLIRVGNNYNITLDYDTTHGFIPGDYVGTMVVTAETIH